MELIRNIAITQAIRYLRAWASVPEGSDTTEMKRAGY
jgi:hypothetical protein